MVYINNNTAIVLFGYVNNVRFTAPTRCCEAYYILLSMSTEDADLYRAAMNEDELIDSLSEAN
jgi:hypothetical protein